MTSLPSALLHRHPRIAVLDFEATCWAERNRNGDEEIIQIGGVCVESNTGSVTSEFDTYVRPVRYPQLSDYCIKLLGIEQERVNRAPAFRTAVEMLDRWLDPAAGTLFAAWGEFDRFLLRAGCRFHRVPFPFDDSYLDIRALFRERVAGRTVNMERAMEILELPAEGRRHDALDDARSAARVLAAMLRPVPSVGM